ncbi:molecular chaperone HtpG [Ferrovibrio terrae]|uniref:Chaperone protein HtpG n=1 Tax=Ferrovibrio terrae TaxID=2594003 RepID=A0A516GXG4_9PROT|nr:molecular chaperone HtpG [Ferrovibrio terrae]QDO96213.1 molecular chaperone HtpG [Ferrovibrio terrae]
MTDQTLQFQSDVTRLLHIVTHALYSQKEIFLRELISNASDACDKLRFAAQTEADLWAGDSDLKVVLTPDKAAGTLTIADNGIGMDRDELIGNLGTIARSGTGEFAAKMTGDAAKDMALIGQFGVGFYSAFMVAEKVEVISRKAGEAQAWRWTSDGSGQFTIGEAEKPGRGTTIILHMRKGEEEFLESLRLSHIVRTYSDHIALPVVLEEGDGKSETLNSASALWARPKSDVTEEQYQGFYHHVSHAFDDPWLTLHTRAEGKLDYSLLLFVPSSRPHDLFDPARKSALRLYVRRVFITDRCDELVPPWLRFLRGVVDSADLPLNVSREMLQHNPVLARIKQAINRRVLTELDKKAARDVADYEKFWEAFGPVLKEGLYEDPEHREAILKLARFRSSQRDGWVSLDDYIAAMKDGQSAIYVISGEQLEQLKHSPQLEGFRAKGVEVLLLTDPVDDFWLSVVRDHAGKPLKSASRAGADLDGIAGSADETKSEDRPDDATLGTLIAALKQVLGDAVKDVRESKRLTDSAVCLSAADGDLDMHLERLLRQHKQLDKASTRILEINPGHPLIKALAVRAQQPGAVDALEDAAHLLLDQARLVEGEPPADALQFAQRLAKLMEKAI